MGDFSETIVNQRFKIVFEELEKNNFIKGKSDIAEKLGTYNHVINSILKGDRNITVEQLHKLFEIYHLNANFLFGLSDEMFLEGYPTLSINKLAEQQAVAASMRRNIVLVPYKAMAGYALANGNVDAIEEPLQRFSIPNFDGNNLVAFEIQGDSMVPNLTNGDLVICEDLERGEPLRDNQVYIVVTDVVVAKRIQQVKQNQVISHLRLISDNPIYRPYDVDINEIRKVLKVRCRLTSYAIN